MIDFKNILYPIDLDAVSASSLTKALEFARLLQCPIHILYVNDVEAGYRHPADHEDTVALRVRELVSESLLENLDIIFSVSKGNIADEIARYAKANRIDLIITGHRHRGSLYAAMFDSTDVHLIDKVSLPVLIFPED